jgi:tetratricopeptide (TPR) repeat protein
VPDSPALALEAWARLLPTPAEPAASLPGLSRAAWVVVVALLAACAWAGFGHLADHGVYFHDLETFHDARQFTGDPGFLLSAERQHRPGRPVATLVKWALFAAVDYDPGAAHLVVVGVHFLASLVLLGVARRLGLDDPTAALAGLLFLLNVASFQAVFHISGLDFPLALILGLPALVCAARRRPAGWLFAGLLLLLAAMAHLAAAAIWAVLLVDALRQRRLRTDAPWLAGLALLLVVGCLLLLALPTDDTTTRLSLDRHHAEGLPAALAGAVRMFLWFLSRLLLTAHALPVGLPVLQPWEWAVGAALLAALLLLLLRSAPVVSLWAAWTLALLLPFSLIHEEITTGGAEGPSHYLYLAAAGASVLLALGITRAAQRLGAPSRWRAMAAIGLAALLLGLSSVHSLRRLGALAHYQTGTFLYGLRPAEAVDSLQRAIATGPELIPLHAAYRRLACALPLVGRDPRPLLDEALTAFPGDPTLDVLRLAADLTDSHSAAAASRRLDRLLGAAPDASDAVRRNVTTIVDNTARGALRLDDPLRAVDVLDRARRYTTHPGADRALLRDACAAAGRQQLDGRDAVAAAALLQRAVDLGAGTPVRVHLARALASAHRWDEAAAEYRRALDETITPDAMFGLGLALLADGQTGAARAAYEAAVDRYGARAGRLVGADRDLAHLLRAGVVSGEARRFLHRWWPAAGGP